MVWSDDSKQDVKERTILVLTHDMREALEDLQCELNGRFARGPQGECQAEKLAFTPNILDEIIQNQEENVGWLRRMSAFILKQVISKIC